MLTDVGDADGHQVLTHRARGPKARHADTCIAVFGPDETVNGFAERRALTEAAQYESTKTLLLIGFGFEASPQPEQKGRVMVYRIQAHQDLRIGELAPDRKADTLVVVAEPDIELAEVEDGQWTLEVRGFDSYDPGTGQVAAHQTVDEIECLMVDTDYDGMAFFREGDPLPRARRRPPPEAAQEPTRRPLGPGVLGDLSQCQEPSVCCARERRGRGSHHHNGGGRTDDREARRLARLRQLSRFSSVSH